MKPHSPCQIQSQQFPHKALFALCGLDGAEINLESMQEHNIFSFEITSHGMSGFDVRGHARSFTLKRNSTKLRVKCMDKSCIMPQCTRGKNIANAFFCVAAIMAQRYIHLHELIAF